MTERIAIIDLGSNSARLIVMHIYENGAYNLVYNQKDAVRLSEGMSQSDELQPPAIERALTTLKVFAHMCDIFFVDKTIAVATAAVRNAKNGQDFIDLVKKETGITFDVVSGVMEAKLGYLGVVNTIDIKDGLLFDLGGGSTELTLIKNRKTIHSVSLPFGAVTLTERFGLQDKNSEEKLAELNAFIMKQLTALPWLGKTYAPLIGVGGTARNIAKMDQKSKNYPFPKIHNYRLGSMSFNELWQNVTKASFAQRRKIPGLSSERADIITAGISIIKCLFTVTQANQLIVSGCGVREGLFMQYYQTRADEEELVNDILMHSTYNLLLSYTSDVTHSYHVSALAESMFDGWKDALHLKERDRKLLTVAALLHDIGITINYYDHARHSAYLIENASLFGLTHREQMMAAVIAGWHHGPSAKYFRNRTHTEFLDEQNWQTARKLALILAIAESLDTTQMGLVEDVTASVQNNKVCLQLSCTEPVPNERHALGQLVKWIKKDFGMDLHIVEQ